MIIKNKELKLPLIQGGMGVGISLGGLAGAVAKEGGIGIISMADPGYREPDFWQNFAGANKRALAKEVAKAREIAGGKGMIGINAMVAMRDYTGWVSDVVEIGVDCIISGAGLPSELPELVKDTDIAIAPIVSSAKAAGTICKMWHKRHGIAPDFVVIEGSKAGGHLGFKADDLLAETTEDLATILAGVKMQVAPYEEIYGRKIPIFVAGGIDSADEVEKFMSLGADGVQVATPFIATVECDAADGYKEAFIRATKEDIQIVQSPVGMPGRAIRTPLIERLEREGRIQPTRCLGCLKMCKPSETKYCISQALISAAEGDYENGLFFCGANAWKIDKIRTVAEVIDELMPMYRGK